MGGPDQDHEEALWVYHERKARAAGRKPDPKPAYSFDYGTLETYDEQFWDEVGRFGLGRTNWGFVPNRNARARAAAQAWAASLMRATDWVLLDTETTGISPFAQVVQISILHPSGGVLLDTLVQPTVGISLGALAAHGIRPETLSSAVPYPVIHPVLTSLLSGRTVVAYNASFDSQVLAQTARAHGLPGVSAKWDCAMEAYACFVGRWSDWHGDFTWQKLPGAKHRAVDDCRATLALIRQIATWRPWWKFW